MKMENPARANANRVPSIKSLGRADIPNPIEIHPEIQSEMLAVRSVMRRFRVTYWHAKTICRLHGLGGQRT